MKSQCLALFAAYLLDASSAVRTRLRWCWQAFTFLLDLPSTRGCSACASFLCLPRRLLMSCTCPPLCSGALWPMPT